jgi:hypothetical protein
MVTGLPLVSCRDGVFVGCVLDKHHWDSFDKRAFWHASGPLQLVHSDLCGPLSSPSFSGCKYFLTFIDDFSRCTWVYFLKLKSEVFDKFLAYKALIEKQSGHQIQRLKTHNGGKYVNHNFTSYCTTHGIQMQHTVPYTPQQNSVVSLPKGRKLVRCKWVYRTKYASDGSVERHKARLVAKGFSQVEGIDYNETFSPVEKMNSIRLILSLAVSHKWEVHQMIVKSTFLHEDLQEEIYMEQPPGYVQNDSSLVCRLKKSLYGLKQAPRAWYAKMDSFLIVTGLSRCHSDPNVYTKKVGSHLIILVLYVDDLILTSSDSKLLNHVKTSLKKKFEMTDLSFLYYFLGLQVLQTNE